MSLIKIILDVLRNIEIDYCIGMVGQCYDGAAVMTSIHGGCLKTSTRYVHSHARRLNFVVWVRSYGSV